MNHDNCRLVLILWIGVLCSGSASEAGTAPPDRCAEEGEGCREPSLLEAARSLTFDPPTPIGSSPGLALAPENPLGGWLGSIWREHRYHFLTVFLVEEADYLYESRIGTPDNPRLFGSPGSLDRAIFDRYSHPGGARNFIAKNKTTVLRAVSLGAMVMVDGRDWQGLGEDFIGLLEAHKLNWASSSLVKTIIGRRRPVYQEALEEGADPGLLSLYESAASNQRSFYSDAASRAFTYMAYTDSVVARRLRGRPWARAFCAMGLYGLAGYIAYTRIEQGQHYLTDVLAGAGAGFTIGKLVYRANHEKEEEIDEGAAVTFQPLVVPGGAGLTMSVRF